jgi:hypothetical protein
MCFFTLFSGEYLFLALSRLNVLVEKGTSVYTCLPFLSHPSLLSSSSSSVECEKQHLKKDFFLSTE